MNCERAEVPPYMIVDSTIITDGKSSRNQTMTFGALLIICPMFRSCSWPIATCSQGKYALVDRRWAAFRGTSDVPHVLPSAQTLSPSRSGYRKGCFLPSMPGLTDQIPCSKRQKRDRTA